MRLNVLFGSSSDKDVYEPLCRELQKIDGVSVNMEVCSAHRQPDRLRKIIKDEPCDLYIAGAGLAAHLPGVIASQTAIPVIGIPCNDILEGYDALLSTIQMPKGVPVLSTGISKIEPVVNFVNWYSQNRKQPPSIRIHSPTWAAEQVAKLSKPLEEIGWDFVKHAADVDHAPAVLSLMLADLAASGGESMPFPVSKSGIWIGAPVLATGPYTGDLKSLGRITGAGGLWVGINNITNLQIVLLQLWPVGSKERDLLQKLRQGEKQSVG